MVNGTHSQRLAFAEEVMRIIRELCKLIFNVSSDEQLADVFGATREQMETMTKKIINALPDRIFEPGNKKKLEEIKAICAREIIFFQVQEKWNDAQYETDLANFMRIFTRDIERQF